MAKKKSEEKPQAQTTNLTAWRFPLRRVEYRDEKTHVDRGKRTSGESIAKGTIQVSADGLKFSVSPRETSRIATSLACLQDAADLLVGRLGADCVKALASTLENLPLVFTWNNQFLMETLDDKQKTLCVDANVDAEAQSDLESLKLIFAMGLFAKIQHLLGKSERESLHASLCLFTAFTSRERNRVKALLRESLWDNSGSFSIFLHSATDAVLAKAEDNVSLPLFDGVDSATLKELGKEITLSTSSEDAPLSGIITKIQPALKQVANLDAVWTKVASAGSADLFSAAERQHVLKDIKEVLKWRDKWVTWMIGRLNIDVPYHQWELIDLLSTEMEDVDEKRALVNQAISRSYNPAIEGANIQRLSDWALENDVHLVSGRLSRAFGNQAHLLSASKYVTDRSVMRAPVEKLAKAAKGLESLDTHITRISSLASRTQEVPYAQLKGAIDQCEKALVDYQNQKELEILSSRSLATESVFEEGIQEAKPVLTKLNTQAAELFGQIDEVRRAMNQASRRDASYVIMLQRFHPAETINLANANSGRDVHPGKEEDLRDLARIGGHNTYASPGNGIVMVDGQPQGVNWINKVGDWIEAIPLFIHERVVRKSANVGGEEVDVDVIETAVDQEAMEAFFRFHAEYWSQNIDEVVDSFCVEIARQVCVESVPALQKAADAVQKAQGVSFAEAARLVITERAETHDDLAVVAAAVLQSNTQRLGEIAMTIEKQQVDRLQAMRMVLLSDAGKKPSLIQEAISLSKDSKSLKALAEACLRAAKGQTKKAIETDSRRLFASLGKKTRRTPNLHILTTESAGMTEGYVQGWVEEEMALYNVIRAKGLENQVAERMQRYRDRIAAISERVIEEFGMTVVVDEVMAEQKLNRSQSVMTVVFSYRPVADEVGKLAALIEHFCPDSGADVSEPQEVLDYIESFRSDLEAIAIPKVVENNGHAFQIRMAEWLEEHPDADFSIAERITIENDPDYEDELQSLVLAEARTRVIAAEDAENPTLQLAARSRNYLREHTQVARSTARKETIAQAGLQASTIDPMYYYQATGPNKRYNLLYTPSRVNLGEHERVSVAVWRQWVGGADWQAAQAGFNFYSLINEGGVEERPALAHAEIQKTSENALTVTHFAGSNALGLLVNAVLEGDVEDMADQMNLRGDRYVPPAGEGYGGYCVPKDGLFLAFVLSLTNDVKLRQMGIPENLHKGIMALAKRAILAQERFGTVFEWQEWAARDLLKVSELKEYFDVREDGLLVFHITKIAQTIQRLGEPWSEVASGTAMLSNLAARWSVEHMIINAEQVNRFMTFYKAWLMYQALEEARRFNPYAPTESQARIAISAEYKPVQDVRFSTGLRLFEMLAQTCEHLMHSLDEEGQNLAYLMLNGFDPESEHPVGRRAVEEVYRQLGVASHDSETIERLKKAFPKHDSPGDIVITSVTMSSTKDMLFYTSDTRMDQIADRVKVKLGDFGLSEEQITANCQAFGGSLRLWAGLRQLPQDQLEKAVSDVGGEIHSLVLKLRGPGRDYEKDIQGIDVLNTGIPFPELLALLDDMPKLISLMLNGNPNSALAITDGTSGRARRSLTFRDVQNFFAACEKRGKRGVYKAVGLGENNVNRLREDMRDKRSRGLRIYEALDCVVEAKSVRERNEAIENALSVYTNIVDRILASDEPSKAIREEERLKRYKKHTPADACISEGLARVRTGLPLQQLDVATWLTAFGGFFVVLGEDQSVIDQIFETIDEATKKIEQWCKVKKIQSAFTGNVAKPEDIQRAQKNLVRPRFVPEAQQFAQEMLVESSSKAVEVAAIEALERRQALRARAARAKAFGQREEGFLSSIDPHQKGTPESYAKAARKELVLIERICDAAFESESALPGNDQEDCHRAFGRFLASARNYLNAIARSAYSNGSDEDIARLVEFEAHTATAYTGREVIMENWKLLAGGYENLGDIARLAEKLKDDASALADVAQGVEFFYVTLALAQTLEFAIVPKDEVDIRLFWKRAMDFFAETINDHFYPYSPWAFSRGVGFAHFEGDSLYALCNKHHAWLYKYLYNMLVYRTDYGDYPEDERDALLGNFLGSHTIPPIGGEAAGAHEKRWRAYNQIREVIFMRGDGFQAPVVFTEFDPDIIEADRRVNLVFLYPVGRTHISRAFREAPTLSRLMKAEGKAGMNMIVTRHGEFIQVSDAKRECLMVSDGHLYLSESEYIEALTQKGLSEEEIADEIDLAKQDGRLTQKGIRAAVRFVQDGQPAQIIAAGIFPFHGLPIYEDGRLESAGLPATVQTVIFTDLTYDKSLYPKIFDKQSGVELPDEIDWLQEYGEGREEKEILEFIEKGVPGKYPGIASFSKKCPILLIKGAAESGARNLKVFDLSGGDAEELQAAVQFVYEVGKKQNVVIQQAVLTSPEFWASSELMEQFIERQILEWNRPAFRDRYPRSQIYGSLRVIGCSSGPDKPYDTAFLISLISLQVATNVGRGGTLEPLRDWCIQDEHRDEIMEGLKAEVPKVFDAIGRYAQKYRKEFERRHGRPVLSDLRGVSYTWPAYMMLDYLVSPVFKRPGKLVDIEPKYDETGRRIGSKVILQDKKGRFEGEITNWEFIHLEPNIGIGLWDRFNLREEEMERRRCEAEGCEFNWDNVGTSDRIVLGNFAEAGRQYLKANFSL